MTGAERLVNKYDASDADGCWPWLGGKTSKGYGMAYFNASRKRAHRAVYEMLVGPVPDGLTLDHLCRNPSCV